MRVHRLIGTAVATLAVACGGLALTSAPALAGFTHKYLSQLTGAGTPAPESGTFGSTNGLAVGGGNVWVVDGKNKVVDEFSASSGEYEGQLTGVGITGVGSGTFGEPNSIAVDSNGNIWVSDGSNKVVDEFSKPGTLLENYVGQLTGAGTLATAFGSELVGIAADSGGNVWVSDGDNKVVDEFSASSRAYEGQLTGAEVPGGVEPGVLGNPEHFGGMYGLAVDSSGNVWVGDAENKVVDEFSASSRTYEGQLTGAGTPATAFGSVGAVAVDSSGDVLVSDNMNKVVDEFSKPGTPFAETFKDRFTGEQTPAGEFKNLGTPALAVDSTGNVWVGENEEPKAVDEFGPAVPLPEVRTLGTKGVVTSTSATVTGEVNPEGEGLFDASGFFEYGPCAEPSSCATSPYEAMHAPAVLEGTSTEDLGNGNAFVKVEGKLGNLQPNKTYHYRIVGDNSNGTSEPGAEGTFTTAAIKPVIEGVEALFASAQSVEFSSVVNAENELTNYKFEYGPCTEPQPCAGSPYSDSTTSASAGEGYRGVAVYQQVEGLTPSTTYHYKLVVKNPTGITESEGTFATQAEPPPVMLPSAIAPTAATGAATGIGTSAATLNGEVDPNNAPTTYRFELAAGSGAGALYTTIASGEAGFGGSAVGVAINLAGLQPGTTYSYRLTAVNAYGSATSAPVTFTTPGVPAAFTQPLAPALLAVPSFPAVKVGKVAKRPTKLANCRAKAKRIKNANKRKRALARCAKRKSVH
jgi:hypothetical protein